MSEKLEKEVLSIEDIMARLEAESKSSSSKFVSGRVYTRNDVTADMLVGLRLAPQAQVLVKLILEGEGTWTEPQLHDYLEENVSLLKTKQTAWKIFKYYRKQLETAGFISRNK